MMAQMVEKEIFSGSDGTTLGAGRLSLLLRFCVSGKQFLDLRKLYCQENQYLLE